MFVAQRELAISPLLAGLLQSALTQLLVAKLRMHSRRWPAQWYFQNPEEKNRAANLFSLASSSSPSDGGAPEIVVE